MRIRTFLTVAGVATCLAGSPVAAQLAMAGEAGVVMGQVGIIASDLDAQRAFWAELGGTPVQNGRLEMIRFPGVFVTLRQGEPTGGTVGSTINHIGFNVQQMSEWLPKWQAAGLEIETTRRPTQIYLMAPEGVRVEILEDPNVAESLQFHHVHFYVVEPLETQSWYQQMLGAVPGRRAIFDAGDLPGVNLTFSGSDTALPAIAGRSLDNVGFEVKDLESFSKKLEAAGVEFERPYRVMGDSKLAMATLVDPWGIKLVLTENLAP